MLNTNKWPSTFNIGKVIQDLGNDYASITTLFNEPVLITEKLDGQNLSRVYSPNVGKCTRYASRNQILDSNSLNGEDFSILLHYDDNIKNLYEENKHIYGPIDEFIVVGELLLQSTNYKSISYNKFDYHNDQIEWRVFGILTVTGDEVTHYYLNKKMYDQFLKYDFQVPKIFFEGILRDGITYMDTIMDMTMEGCVITSLVKNGLENFNYKYKIGYYDDRKNGSIPINTFLANPIDIPVIKMIELMYDRNRLKNEKKITKKDIKDNNSEFIESNVYSELSKRDIDIKLYAGNKKKAEREELVNDIANTIQKEILVDRNKLVKSINAAIGLKIKNFFMNKE